MVCLHRVVCSVAGHYCSSCLNSGNVRVYRKILCQILFNTPARTYTLCVNSSTALPGRENWEKVRLTKVRINVTDKATIILQCLPSDWSSLAEETSFSSDIREIPKCKAVDAWHLNREFTALVGLLQWEMILQSFLERPMDLGWKWKLSALNNCCNF